ncbi:hypothetical protein LUZ60_005578 [Juncus effusus]|nr:hypothetical protein LUZ60_005578 [Juncus effusus]
MKNLFKRKPHRSSSEVPPTPPSPSGGAGDGAATTSCSSENRATSSAAAAPASPAEEVRSQPVQGVGGGGGVGEQHREDYFSSEEEFQIQLAMALSASNSDFGGSDPDGDQIRKATLLSLGRDQIDQARRHENTSAESLSRRYWDYNVIDYHEKLPDGFCDIFMLSPQSSKHSQFPSLSDLQSTIGDLGFEVIVINHTIDTTLQEIEQIAQCFMLDFSETPLLVQRIAELVTDNMGGPVKDANEMLMKWIERSTELRTSLQTSLLPIGCIKIGLSRHRALLFKILADKVGIQCKLVKGSHYTGVDDDAVNIIKLNNDREEYLVDLMAAPGTLIPADILSLKDLSNQLSDNNNIIPISNSNLPIIIPSHNISQNTELIQLDLKPNPFSKTGSTSSNPLIEETDGTEDSRNLFAELNPFGVVNNNNNRVNNNNDNNNNNNGVFQRRRENVSPGPSRPHQQPLVMKNWSAFNDAPFPRRNNNNFNNNNDDASSSSSQRPPLKSPNVNNNNNNNNNNANISNNNMKVQYNNCNMDGGFGGKPMREKHTGGNYLENNVNNGRNDNKKIMKDSNIVSHSQSRVSRIDPVFDDVSEREILWENLVIGERIGLGSYGEVYRADWNGTEVAVKKFLDQDFYGGALDEFRSEVRIMRRLKHPNVVLFMGAVTRPPNLSIVSEFLPRGSLYRLLHRPNCQIDEKRRIRMALDVAKGMSCLHTSVPTIVHRDLKSPNLLVDHNWTVKVCDFGLSRLKHSTFLSSRSTAGTPEWMAPEVLRNEPSNEKCDVYSFGVILWELATLRMPWRGMNPMQVVGAVGFQEKRLDIPKEVDPLVATIIKQCWLTEPNSRPSFAELTTHLKSLQRLVIPPYQQDASSPPVPQEIFVNSPTP